MTLTSRDMVVICPKCESKYPYEIPEIIPPNARQWCKKCDFYFRIKRQIKMFLTSQSSPKKKIIKLSQSSLSQDDTSTKDLEHIMASIENPVAFASAHIFKKMIETGDVRWAQLYVSLLDKTNKLDYETIKEEQWLNQAKNMTLDEIVGKVAIKGSISRSTLRRLDELEDTSPLDNF